MLFTLTLDIPRARVPVSSCVSVLRRHGPWCRQGSGCNAREQAGWAGLAGPLLSHWVTHHPGPETPHACKQPVRGQPRSHSVIINVTSAGQGATMHHLHSQTSRQTRWRFYDSGGASAEDLLSASLFGIVDTLSRDMRGHQVATWKDCGKNQTSLKLLFLPKPQHI